MPWLRDIPFLLALSAGPVVWGVLIWLVPPVSFGSFLLVEPLHYLLVALFYPIIEEAAFRGLLQGKLRKWHWGSVRFGTFTVANLLTSAAFTAFHFINHTPLWALLAFFPSLVFGYFRDRDGTLIRPMMLHVFYNAGYFMIFPILR